MNNTSQYVVVKLLYEIKYILVVDLTVPNNVPQICMYTSS